MAETDRLWAPWRSTFIAQRKRRQCIFCVAKRSRRRDRAHHVIARGRRVFALLNRYPYNNGHLMIAPYRHVGVLEALADDEWAECLSLLQPLLRRLRGTLRAQGFNLGINLGRIAGAGVPGHLHLHVVPRWMGDTNYMSSVSDVRIMSQSLDETYALLTAGRHGAVQ